jgi:hypothetical protein
MVDQDSWNAASYNNALIPFFDILQRQCYVILFFTRMSWSKAIVGYSTKFLYCLVGPEYKRTISWYLQGILLAGHFYVCIHLLSWQLLRVFFPVQLLVLFSRGYVSTIYLQCLIVCSLVIGKNGGSVAQVTGFWCGVLPRWEPTGRIGSIVRAHD